MKPPPTWDTFPSPISCSVLAASAAPIAVAQWQGLPDDARAVLPSVEELEAVVHDELARQASLLADAPQTNDSAGE